MDITKFNREDLVKNLESAKEKFVLMKKELDGHLTEVFSSYAKVKNIPSVHGIRIDSDESISIFIGDKDKSNDINFYFRKDYYQNYKRVLKMNHCCFGQFDSSDWLHRDYIIAIGRFAEEMDVLEKSILDFDWKTYDDIDSEFYKAKNELECYDTEVKNIAFREKCKVIEEKLKEGSEIILGKKNKWSDEKKDYEFVDDVRKVEKLMKKTLVISNIWFRQKKEDVIKKIATGVWKLKE